MRFEDGMDFVLLSVSYSAVSCTQPITTEKKRTKKKEGAINKVKRVNMVLKVHRNHKAYGGGGVWS